MTIDSHVHFWEYDPLRDDWITDDMTVLRRDFLPMDIVNTLKENEVEGIIAVQADQSESETRFLCDLARHNNFIKGIVGWIDLQDKLIEERLAYFSKIVVIKGWRHIVQAEPDDFLERSEFLRGISYLANYNFTYDILIYPGQMKAALDFISRFPGQKFVLDHAAKPDIKNENIDEWAYWSGEIAKNDNVYCKLSGLLTEAVWNHWSDETFAPYLDVLFEQFGADRLMFGSDWPVVLLSGQYAQWKNLMEKYILKNCPGSRMKIFGENAMKFYNI
jgi:L-fuconolactonase